MMKIIIIGASCLGAWAWGLAGLGAWPILVQTSFCFGYHWPPVIVSIVPHDDGVEEMRICTETYSVLDNSDDISHVDKEGKYLLARVR